MSEIEPMAEEIEQLLRFERPLQAAPAGAQQRVLAELAPHIMPMSQVSTVASTSSTWAPIAKYGLVFVGGLASGALGHAAFTDLGPELPKEPAGIADTTPNPPGQSVAEFAPPEPPPAPSPPVKAERSAAIAQRTPVTPARQTLQEEQRLLEVARSALMRERPEAAWRALDEHQQRFPQGRHAEDREVLAILALARAGNHETAQARAKAFRAAYPHSPLMHAVQAALQR